MFDEAPEVMNPAQAAQLMGLGRNTVYAAVRRGEIPSVRVGGRILISKQRLAGMLGIAGLEGGTV